MSLIRRQLRLQHGSRIEIQKNFFHWDLEFPEVFFDEHGTKPNGADGFDVVVGNPPYVRQEGLGNDKVAFKMLYKVFNSIADLYTYFIERGNSMLRQDGRFGMITANKFMRANYGAATRTYLIEQVRLEKIIDFGDLPVFGDATAYPMIAITQKAKRDAAPIEYALIKFLDFDSLTSVINDVVNNLPENAFNGTSWTLSSSTNQAILEKLTLHSQTLSKHIGNKVKYGIKTGFNEAFIIDKFIRQKLIEEDPKSSEIIKPFLIGEDVRRYSINSQDKYLIWTYIGVPINKYPAIFRYLQKYQKQLEKRYDKGNYWWELRPCEYYSNFEQPKILYPVISMSNNFSFDQSDGFYSNDKTFIIPTDSFYLLSLLNSKTLFFFFKAELSTLRGGFFEYRAQTIINTPIRCIDFTTPKKQLKDSVEEGKQRANNFIANLLHNTNQPTNLLRSLAA